MSERINNYLLPGESVEPIAQPKHGSTEWAYRNGFGNILNSTNIVGNSVVIDILPEGATEPVVIVSDITLTVRPLEGNGKAVIWNTEQADDEVRIVDLNMGNPLTLRKNDAYFYLNIGEQSLLIRDDSVPAFQEGDELMLNAEPKEDQIDGRAIELPVEFLQGYELVRKSPEVKEQTTVRSVRPEDIDSLHPVFETWIRDRYSGKIITEEIDELEQEILLSIDSDFGNRKYFVAQDSHGHAVGIMGMQSPPYPEIAPFATTDNPMETINAYVSKDVRLSGTGKALAKYIEDLATEQGYTELLVNSGPRYKDTGWPFWSNLYGKPAGIAVGLYGVGGDAMVWRKSMSAE